MSFIRYKKIGNKSYGYEITSYWDSDIKKSRQRSKYLGVLGEDNKIKEKNIKSKEKLILDFGDSYFLNEFIKGMNIFELLKKLGVAEIFPLIIYRLCNQSAMRNCELWVQGNYISRIFSQCDLSSQNISRVFKMLGEEDIQRSFFTEYLKIFKDSSSIIIDATSLPNQIGSVFNQWGRNDGAIDKQFRFLCVVDQKTKAPLFYRFLPGNLVDVTTLQKTIKELNLMGIKKSFVLIDAGYFSEDNIKNLYELKIDFMSRLPAGRVLYKDMVDVHSKTLEDSVNFVKFHERSFFIKEIAMTIFGNPGYAYIVLDPVRKGKEIAELIATTSSESDPKEVERALKNCGLMILVSSQKFSKENVIPSYYSRQAVEQIFGFFKDDLDSLPLRCHSDNTVQGYLFLQFLTLIVFTQLRSKLPNKFSVEQALLILRSLKAKIFDSHVLTAEKNKNINAIFDAFNIIVPNSLGI